MNEKSEEFILISEDGMVSMTKFSTASISLRLLRFGIYMLPSFPEFNSELKIQEILSQNYKCYRRLTMPGNGRLIGHVNNIPTMQIFT